MDIVHLFIHSAEEWDVKDANEGNGTINLLEANNNILWKNIKYSSKYQTPVAPYK